MNRTTVVIVNFKGAQDTSACLCSLYASGALAPRVVVVDNTPNDPELAAILNNYPGTHLINSPENLGFGGGNNLGIEWALSQTACEFLYIFNNDAKVKQDTISLLERAMDIHPTVGIVTSRIVSASDTTKLWYGGGLMDWRRGGAVAPGINGSSESLLALKSRHVDFASGCSMLVRRELFMKVGLFDSRFFMYEEDINLCLRARRSRYGIWYEASAIVEHGRQGSLRSSKEKYLPPLHPLNPNLEFYIYHTVRNRIINILELMTGKERRLFIVGFSVWIGRHAASYLWNGKISTLRTIFRAVRNGLKVANSGNR